MMKKKDAGFVEKLLPILLSVGIVFGLILLSGALTKVLRVRSEINQTARAYLLEMETKGFLSNDRLIALEGTLKKYGMSDIHFEGTTCSKVDYGKQIQLCIKGKLSLQLVIAIPFFYEESRVWNIPITINPLPYVGEMLIFTLYFD